MKTSRAHVIAPEIRELIRQVASGAPMYSVHTMDDLATRETLTLRFTMLTLGIGSLLALMLSAVGLFGVLSYVVAERTHEIGVRMALGAGAGRVRRMVLMQGTGVVALGVAVGLLAAFWGTRSLSALLFGVEPLDPLTFLAMSVMMLGVGLLASYVPARRASAVDPNESLKGI